MKKNFILILLIISGLLWGTPNAYVVNTISMTLSKINLSTGEVNNNFATLGGSANRVATDGEFIYAINSLDNNMQKINIETGNTISTLNFENSSNPYDLVIVDGFAYVSGLITSKVYKVDLSLFSVIGSVEVNTAPEGITYFNGNIYVACTAVAYPNYGQSTVDVIDINSFTKTGSINVALNCQNVVVSDTKIHAICTGNYSDVPGEADIIDPSTNEVIHSISVGGSPGAAFTFNNLVYVCDGYTYGTIVYDANSYDYIYAPDNPLTTFGSSIFVNSNYIAVTSADYSNNSSLKILSTDGTELNNYEVAVGAVDVIIIDNETSVSDANIPASIWTVKAYPNPFSENATIEIENRDSRSEAINAIVDIFNIKGQIIKTIPLYNGKASWNGKDQKNNQCNSGIYFSRIRVGNKILSTKRITIIR